ncbi:trypsin-1-like isoform X2 [Phlebotomus papatasi]|uniref:trypsin-1-like isoform X2 n=1 Tax=Phlebotomus papatasi TaxID=29031 RepID=UPI002483C60D|nr:trypsin-1-like isoform X2 [Phlebotomus papatasi]
MRFFFVCTILICAIFRVNSFDECPEQIREFPFLASLHYNKNRTCSATILSRYLAVTAASCVYEKMWMGFTLVFGTSSGDYTEDPHNSRAIIAVHCHPRYNPRLGDFDVAVVVFERITFNATVKPLKYPSKPITSGEVVTGGWGIEHDNDTETEEQEPCEGSFELDTTRLMDIKKCRSAYSRYRQISVTRMLCTEPMSHYTCSAEDGAPLVAIRGGVGLGIASNMGKCPQPELPSVFINIHALGIKPFIDGMLNKYRYYAMRSSRGREKTKTDNVKNNRQHTHITTSVPSTTRSTEKYDEYNYRDTKYLKKNF